MKFDRSKPGKAIAHDAWGTTEEGLRLNVSSERYGRSGEVKIFATSKGFSVSVRMSQEEARTLAAELMTAADALIEVAA